MIRSFFASDGYRTLHISTCTKDFPEPVQARTTDRLSESSIRSAIASCRASCCQGWGVFLWPCHGVLYRCIAHLCCLGCVQCVKNSDVLVDWQGYCLQERSEEGGVGYFKNMTAQVAAPPNKDAATANCRIFHRICAAVRVRLVSLRPLSKASSWVDACVVAWQA